MTVTSATRKAGPFLGNGVNTLFPFTFKIFEKEDVRVTLTDANGVDSILTLDSDYSVSVNTDQDNNPGGTITYPRVGSGISVLLTGNKLTLTGSLPYDQQTDLPNPGPYYAKTIENTFDREEIQIQQLKELSDRSIKIGVSDTPLLPLPGPSARANTVFGFDAMGNATVIPIPSSVGAGDRVPFTFVSGVDFTAGVTTQLTLPRAPGSQGNLEVFFDPLFQGFDQWSVNGQVLTFTTPIPVGVTKIFGYVGTTLSTQIPPGGSVDDGQINWPGLLARTVDSISALRALSSVTHDRAFVTSIASLGYGAFYCLDHSDTSSTDDGWSIVAAADTGIRWKRQDVPVRTGTVRMVQTGVSTWMVFGPQGEQVSTVGTTTSGLQEAINYAGAKGYSLHVVGGMTTSDPGGMDQGLLFCSTPIAFPALRSCRIDIHGAHIIFSAAVTGPGFNFDSCMEVMVDVRGSELVYQGNGSVLHFAPTNPVPVDPQIGIVDTEFQLGSIVATGGAPLYCVHFNCTGGPITDSKFAFAEINCNGAVGMPSVAAIGVAVEVPASGSGFTDNVVEVRHVHHFTKAGVQVGLNATGASSIGYNQWKLTSLSPNEALATGFNTFGHSDLIDIGTINSAIAPYLTALFTEPSSYDNFFRVGQISGSTGLAVNNQGRNNKIWANGAFQDPKAGANMGGVNQSIPTGAWTKVAFTAVDYQVGPNFDTINNRWVPGSLGHAEIVAFTAWDTIVAGNALWVAVTRNGAIMKQARIVPSATSGGQGPVISTTIPVLAATDYFEIYVQQSSGASQTLDGAAADTWATFKMVS